MSPPGYPAARFVAPIVHAHFAKHIAAARLRDESLRQEAPDPADIEAIIDAAFWASLRREEGFAPKISLALVPPATALHPLRFERSLPLNPASLVKVAPAVERAGIHLGVWHEDGALKVWGTTRTIPTFCLVLEVATPGLLVVKHHRGEVGKFVNVAVLEGEQVKIIDERASGLPDCPELLVSMLGFDGSDQRAETVGGSNVLVQLAVSMRAHNRGGILLVVPPDSDSWQASIVRPVSYSVAPAFSALASLVRNQPPDPRGPVKPGSPEDDDLRVWQDELEDTVSWIAGLTAVDGATVITSHYDVLAFGAKIARRDGHPLVERVTVTEPIEGASSDIVHPTRLGGTRHLSAAQFVQDQQGALALVASQDGRFTVFAWSPCEAMVHAHRVETLLL